MPIRLVVDGEPRVLEVDLAKGEARLGTVMVPFRVVDDAGPRVELELDGEKFVLEGWPPTGSVEGKHALTINRETHRLEVAEVGASQAPTSGPTPGARPTSSAPTAAPTPGASVASGPGTAISPPMPGKVLEVRVSEGDRVAAGQVLLVLEAMKMRNEVQSPVAGVVQGLRAAAGASVKAHEVLLRVVPG